MDDYFSIGTDVVFPFETYCKMDIKKFREKYPDAVICQPIDCTQLLPFGLEEVREVVVKAIEDSGKKQIIIGSTSEIPPYVKFQNAVAMYETARNYEICNSLAQ